MQTQQISGRVNILRAALSALALLFALTMLFAPTRAHAQTKVGLATCLIGTHEATWNPGLTNTTHLVQVTTNSQWVDCTGTQGPLINSASSEESFPAEFSCASLLQQTPPITWVITWGDGATSTYIFTATINSPDALAPTITGQGTITAGRYANAQATTTFVLSNLSSSLTNLCATTGVTNASGLSTLTIYQASL